MRSFPLIEANLYRRYIAQREVHLRSKTDTLPQTVYDDYDDDDYNHYNDYDDLRAQVLWIIEVHLLYE
jgi:hypothetical protein